MRRVLVVAVLVAMAVGMGVPTATGRALWSDPAGLPAPFATWAVTVEPFEDTEQVFTLSFDSPLLARRVHNRVWLPDVYVQGRRLPTPVVYSLHGTCGTSFGEPVDSARSAATGATGQRPPWVSPAACRTGAGVFAQHLDDLSFVVVAPDAEAPNWCGACNWIDGREGQGVAADSHLHDELMPLVEALFDVRSDRGGRAVIGHSMGGGGAAIQGFKHPDRFLFAGSSSGTLTLMEDFQSESQGRWLYYNRTQGFGPLAVDEIHYRNWNLTDLAPNVVGTGIEIVAVIGDGCVDPSGWGEGSCPDGAATAAGDPNNTLQEVLQRHNNELVVPRLVESGVPITYVRREGHHGIFSSTFERYFLPRLEELFGRDDHQPAAVSYKATDRAFTAWGWDVEVLQRPNTEFLHLLGARTDGTSVVLAGAGVVKVTTPPGTAPAGAPVSVRLTPAGQEPVTVAVTADAAGRVAVEIDLGPVRAIDERRELVEAGAFDFPSTRLDVVVPGNGRG
jgi:hypothetical protein